jgi:hypothetical protein
MHDPVKYALWVGGFSLAIAIICGGYVAWLNGGSRNIGLGLGAVLGACVVFILQILFDLKSSSTSTDFAVEFVTDYQSKEVHSPRAYNPSMTVAFSYRNLFIEAEASKALAVASPPLSRDDAPKIARDLGILSIISFLLDEQSDWQLDTKVFKTSLGTTTQWMRVSKPDECTLVTKDMIQKKLKAAGNMFADVPIGILMGDKASLCLPPHALLDITKNSVALRTYVCSITFTLQEPMSSMTTIDPHVVAASKITRQPIKTEAPILADGSPRYVTVDVGTRATVEFASLRAQDRNLSKYQSWAKRVVEGVNARFEVPE